jgi:hypothetical protein
MLVSGRRFQDVGTGARDRQRRPWEGEFEPLKRTLPARPGLLWWLIDPIRFRAAFRSFIWPVLGII